MNAIPTTPAVALNVAHTTYLADRQAIPSPFALEAGVRSYTGADDLPESIAWAGKYGPGILFRHEGPTGTIVYQVKPDTKPADSDSKYIQEAGVQALSIHPSRKHLIGKATRIVIVEGTKQALAVAAWAAPDWLVIGVQGCNGWSHNGVPLPELTLAKLADPSAVFTHIVTTATATKLAVTEKLHGPEVVVLFDGDAATNYNVRLAADRLAEVMELDGAAMVTFAAAPTSSGVDDYLASRIAGGDDLVRSSLALILANGKTKAKLGRMPAKPKRTGGTAVTARVDVEGGRIIREQKDIETGRVTGVEVLLEAAITITRTVEIHDPLNDILRKKILLAHDLDIVMTDPKQERFVTVSITDVPDRELCNVRLLLNRAGVIGTTVTPNPEVNRVDQLIEAAIRDHAADRRKYATEITHVGWTTAPNSHFAVYAHVGGGISQFGEDNWTRAHVGEEHQPFDFSGALPKMRPELRTALTKTFELLRSFKRPEVSFAILGHTFAAFAGLDPKGGYAFIGPQGSGKSAAMLAAGAFVSPEFVRKPMFSVASTPKSLPDAGRGICNAPYILDDYKRLLGNQFDSITNALDTAIRVGYGDPRPSRLKVDRNTNDVVSAPGDRSQPHFVMAGEIPLVNASALERQLIIRFKGDHSNLSDNTDSLLDSVGLGGYPQMVSAAFISWCAKQIDTSGEPWKPGFKDWVKELRQRRDNHASDLLLIHEAGVLTPRTAKLVGHLLVGVELFAEFVEDATPGLGILGIPDLPFLNVAQQVFVAAAVSHHQSHLAHVSPQASAIEKLATMLITGDARMVGSEPLPMAVQQMKLSAPEVAVKTLVAGEPAMAFIPATSAKALRSIDPHAGWTEQTLKAALADVAIKSTSGATLRLVGIAGAKVQCLVIPMDTWLKLTGRRDDDPVTESFEDMPMYHLDSFARAGSWDALDAHVKASRVQGISTAASK
ncbi:hypothetical protein [Cryobacterium sp. GrIS_2_6]|uniref:hypothetical protein n=1 Tax=Cryobacterium sp. GrIS_2_6 TaxID=3162785 RepID=UPI002E00B741|nr:hypothetical protein [Cryobacterium psychrotolerans]